MDSVITITPSRSPAPAGLDGWQDVALDVLDGITEGHKGQIATFALREAGFAGPGIDAVYDANPQAIDAYFEHIDLDAVLHAFTNTPTGKRASEIALYAGGALVAGLIIGYLLG